jgi:hypothetical protein
VPAARPAEAARISAAALAGVAAPQRDDGLFADPTGRVVGSSGLPTLAWAALHADGEGAAERLVLARRTLARGSGATVILRWPLAMAVADELAALPADDRSELRGRVASWARGALPVPRRLPAAAVHAPARTPAVHGLRQRAPAEPGGGAPERPLPAAVGHAALDGRRAGRRLAEPPKEVVSV